MKAVITKNYFDKELKRRVQIGEELDVTEARAKTLAKANVAAIKAGTKQAAQESPVTEPASVGSDAASEAAPPAKGRSKRK